MYNLETFIKPTQTELFDILCKMYQDNAIVYRGKFIIVPGEAKVGLVAHLDTVHTTPVKQIIKQKNGDVWSSPQGIGGDDRCGVYALVSVYERAKVKPWLIFACDEEIGCVGASHLAEQYDKDKLPRELEDLNFLIEIDRRGSNDAVYYNCDNPEFEQYISSKGFIAQFGAFSDISVLAPALGVAAVNLSSGYYNAHTKSEYIVVSQLEDTINRVIEIVEDEQDIRYDYIESTYGFGYGYGFGFGYGHASHMNTDGDKNIPKEIEREYNALLDYYSRDSLEEIRRDVGDRAILWLFESEFGCTYDEVMNIYGGL